MSTYSIKLTAKPADRNIGLSWTLPRNFKNSNNYTLHYFLGIPQLPNFQLDSLTGGMELLFTSNSSKYVFINDISNNTKGLLNSYPYGLYLTAYDISGVAYESNRISSAPVGKNNGILLTTTNAESSINLNWTFKNGISSKDNYYVIYLVPDVTKQSNFVSKYGSLYDTDPITNNTYLIEDLSNNISYGLFVATTDVSGYLLRQSDLLFVTPTNGIKLTAKPLNYKVNLSWTFNKGFISSTNYRIICQPNAYKLEDFISPFSINFSTSSFTRDFGQLEDTCSYGIQLISLDASNNEVWHSNVVFSIPLPEQNMKVTGTVGDKKISLKWKFNKTDTTDGGYFIYYVPNVSNITEFNNNTPLTHLFDDISNTKMYDFTGLANNISYGLYLHAQDDNGAYISNIIFVTPQPSETITLTGKAGVRKIDLSWTFKNKVITSDTNYDLYYVPNAKNATQFKNGPLLNINFTDISNKSYQFNQDISGNVSYGMYLHTQDASNNEFISKTIFVTAKK
jgi:hypothetical protein